MHILVVNDDGPPSNQSSPYVHSLVKTLQEAGHIVSVVLPHTQRSWIGKAHIIGQTVKPLYFRPGTLHKDDGTTHTRPLPPGAGKDQEEWILVDGTPASCVQIGLYHYFQDRPPIDLVVSGPNYGRNSTAIFSLSSGTVGGALEAAVCKRKAIALSYAFFSRNHDRDIIAGASRLSVRLIEYLYQNWNQEVDLYTVNVPLVEDVDKKKVMWTKMLQNYWGPGSCFQEVPDEGGDPEDEEQKIREGESTEKGQMNGTHARHTHKHFKWSPRFADVYQSVEEAGPGNDGWTVKEGLTSITPLKANFAHASAPTEGELKLPSTDLPKMENLSVVTSDSHFYALVDYEDEYVQPLILEALEKYLPPNSYKLISSISELPSPASLFLQIGAYESLPFEHAVLHTKTSFINAYMIRKALIRKHYLSTTAYHWVAKNPTSILATNLKPSCEFEIDYAEFLDDALVEAWDLKEGFEKNEGKEPEEREWWILKPGMSDRGQGIRLFSTEDELRSIFEEWEEAAPDSDEDDAGSQVKDEEAQEEKKEDDGEYIVTSHLRHFIAQLYIHPPLLLESDPRKFHIRTYVLAVGALKVFVYRPMLALFASVPYVPPHSPTASPSSSHLAAHLTNTCLQSSSLVPFNPNTPNAVELFGSLRLSEELKESIVQQIFDTTGEIFEAAARGKSIHFQPFPNAFEVFGLDYLVDEAGRAWLLEVNAFPDFRQTGGDLKSLVGGFWKGVVEKAVGPFFGFEGKSKEGEDLVLVREIDLGRR
ncbi:tubulin-tyrosine ligase family protein-like protein [Bisporella sp. PMI_857]|nr:tubulin-tyrosine ligase family protein-like protein [Bisporella sp. PMI_857]